MSFIVDSLSLSPPSPTSLTGNGVGPEGANSLAEALKENSSLKILK